MSLYDHLAQLRMVSETVEQLLQRTRNAANQFNGVEPELAKETPDRPTPGPSINSEFGYHIANIQEMMRDLNYHLTRIEQEVINTAPPTSSSWAAPEQPPYTISRKL